MKPRLNPALKATAVFATVFASTLAGAQALSEKDLHLEAATRNTGGDEFLLDWTRDRYCMYVDNAPLLAEIRRHTAPVSPVQLFDDVWYVGFENVGQFIIKTHVGFGLVDSLNRTSDADNYTIPMLDSLGIGPQLPLAGVYLTHGHFDHDGGASRLRQVYGNGFPIYIGSGDIAGKTYLPTALDSADFGYQTMSLGDRPLTVIASPGHTPGTMSAFIPVTDNGVQRQLLIVGGTAIPTNIAASRQYVASVERMYAAAKEIGAEGTLHPHPIIDGGNQHMADIRAAGSRTPNPYILGNEKLLRTVAIMRECGAAQVGQVDATAKLPVWRVTRTEFIGNVTPNNVAVKVSSDWGPVANQAVTFTVPQTNVSCIANTDAEGVARCNIHPLRPFQDAVVATFEGTANADYVDLGSTRSAAVGAGRAPGK